MTDDARVDRRRFLGVAATTGAAALVGSSAAAGQSGTDADANGTLTDTVTQTVTATDVASATESSTTPTTDGDGPAYPDATHVGVTSADPTAVQYNPLNDANAPEISQYLLFERFAQYNYATHRYEPAAIVDWEYTGDAFVMVVRDGLTWSNGDAVTAEDVAIQLELAMLAGQSLDDWATGVAVVDDRTVEIAVEGTVNESIVESDVFGRRWLGTDRATYGPKLDAVKNGDTPIEDVTGFVDEDPVTCGPFTLERREADGLYCQRFPDHPDADDVNFGEYVFEAAGSSEQRAQALLNNDRDSDYQLAVANETVTSFPDSIEHLAYDDVFGIGLTPNHDDEYAGDRAVRRAIAYAIDRGDAAGAPSPLMFPPQVPCGLAREVTPRWLGDDRDRYDDYGSHDRQTSDAAAVLQAGGYSNDDGSWVDADGDPVSITLTVPGGWSSWVISIEQVAADLREFGFDVAIETTGNYFEVIENGDFQFVANTWLPGGPTAHPYFTLRHQLYEPLLHTPQYNYPPATETAGVGGQEATVSVPSRYGDGTVEVDPGTALEEIATTDDEATERARIRQLAWVVNQDLPMIPIGERQLMAWFTTEEWDVPTDLQSDPAANVGDPSVWLPRKGKLAYHPEPDESTPTIRIELPDTIEQGESAWATVTLSNVPDGLDSFDVTMTLDSDTAIFLDSDWSLAIAVGNGSISADDQRLEFDGADGLEDGTFDAVDPGDGSVVLGRVRLAGSEVGTATVELSVDEFVGDQDGAATPVGEGGTVEVVESDLPAVDGTVPLDLDGDGTHKDLSGNSQIDFQDVVTYFQNMQSDAMQNHPGAYDYSGNEQVDYQDLIRLFKAVP